MAYDGDEGDYDNEYDEYDDEARRPQLSPIRLRMGWRRNGELEVRTHELQRMLDRLRPVTDAVGGGDDPKKLSKEDRGKAIDATVRRFEQQQTRLQQLEREIDMCNKAKSQAVSSRAEMVRRAEEERKRADNLEQKLKEMHNRLERSQRQVELLRNPTGQPADDPDDPDKPKPMHMRVADDQKKRGEKREAAREKAEVNRTYAPAIDPTSASIAKSTPRTPTSAPPASTPQSLAALTKAAESKENSTSSPDGSILSPQGQRRFSREDIDGEGEESDAARRVSREAQQVELSTERRRRETVEAALVKAELDAKNAIARRAEVEIMLQRMENKERDQNTELQAANRAAKEAKSELGLARKLSDAAQMDAAQKGLEARQLLQERISWEAERVKVTAEKDEAVANAAEQIERSKSAESALATIAAAAPPSEASVKAARQSRGIKDHPNADQVQRQQQKAKVEKSRLQMEEEIRIRKKAERELDRALNEQQRLKEELEKVASVAVASGDAAAAIVAAEAAKEAAKESALAPAADRGESPASMRGGSSGGRGGGGGGGGVGGSRARSGGSRDAKDGNKESAKESKEAAAHQMQRHLRSEMEESALIRELSTMENELHNAKAIAGSVTSVVAEEQQRRMCAEAALDRYTRISALQRAAQEALQFTMASPGRGSAEEDKGMADEALAKLAAEIRASGLGAPSRGHSPRSHDGTGTPRIQPSTTHRGDVRLGRVSSPSPLSQASFAPPATMPSALSAPPAMMYAPDLAAALYASEAAYAPPPSSCFATSPAAAFAGAPAVASASASPWMSPAFSRPPVVYAAAPVPPPAAAAPWAPPASSRAHVEASPRQPAMAASPRLSGGPTALFEKASNLSYGDLDMD